MIPIDFLSDELTYRRKLGGGKNQAIAKACGIDKNYKTLIDATAGRGEDAFILAALGFEVTLIERHPEVYQALCQALDALDALDNLSQGSEETPETKTKTKTKTKNKTKTETKTESEKEISKIYSRLKIYGEDAKTLIPKLPKAEVILLDPMFPERKKSALVKKPMREIKSLVGDDLDADALLPIALSHATKRVVVKRPKQAPFLNQQKPSFQLIGKSSRFDIYLISS
jgi:16S rRNA (guanine1516-N2)-methyltransferase